MNKYERLIEELDKNSTGQMKCFGNSMEPILKTGGKLTFQKQEEYKIGDIVFCKVKGRYIDAHKITKIDLQKGYMIANNKGWENGWTKTIFGKAVEVDYGNNQIYEL